MILVKGAALGFYTVIRRGGIEFHRDFVEIEGAAFRGNSYDSGEGCCAWFLYRDSQRLYRVTQRF